MTQILFLDSISGVAGDMFAAAFVDAGIVSIGELASLPARLGLEGVRIEARTVSRNSARATHLRVSPPGANHPPQPGPAAHAHGGHDHPHPHPAGDPDHETHLIIDASAGAHSHAHFSDIDRLIAQSDLSVPVRDFARRVFRLLAEAEAEAHGVPIEAVAFHEVGSVDSIMDVVMAGYCLAKISPGRCCATPLRPGRGLVKMAHGVYPIPPPASSWLLIGIPISNTPAAIQRENVELSTPTGIAILKAIGPEFVTEMPAGTLTRQGFGAGSLDFDGFPNVFRVAVLDEEPATLSSTYETDRVVEIASNIDDDTGEHIAWMAEQLLAQGALDVWLVPATGKKGRPLVCLCLLCHEEHCAALADWLLRHGTTFGVRYRPWARFKLARRFERRSGPAGEVSYKIGLTRTGEVLKEKAEYDDRRKIWDQAAGVHHPAHFAAPAVERPGSLLDRLTGKLRRRPNRYGPGNPPAYFGFGAPSVKLAGSLED